MGRVGVSVVVVADSAEEHASADTLASLSAQSLPATAFEVVWVDNRPAGSDDTASPGSSPPSTRAPNLVPVRIPDPSTVGQLRNAALRVASGEYVFFLGHHGRLFPEALARMVGFAREHRLDVVLPKETATGAKRPDSPGGRQHRPLLTDLDPAALHSLTAHKLYRREYLIEHDIWFAETTSPLADAEYNAAALAQTSHIGALGDYPCCAAPGEPEPAVRHRSDGAGYRAALERSARTIAKYAEGTKREQLLAHWYRTFVLGLVGASYAALGAAARERVNTTAAAVLPEFAADLDRLLTPAERARSVLLRAGDHDALLALSRADAGLRLQAQRTEARWDDGGLLLSVHGRLAARDGIAPRFHRNGDRLIRVLPAALDGTGADEVDLAADLAVTTGEIVLRERSTDVDWILPAQIRVELEAGELHFELESRLDPATAAAGQPLRPDIWDLFYRLDGLGWAATTWLPAPVLDTPTALVNGAMMVLYETKPGFLAVDAAERGHTMVGSAIPRLANARLGVAADGAEVTRIALPRTHVAGESLLTGSASIDGEPVPAQLIGHGGRATLVVQATGLETASSVRTRFGGRDSAALFGTELAALDTARSVLQRLVGGAADPLTGGDPADLIAGLADEFPPAADRYLTAADRAYATLLRAGEFDALNALARADAGLRLLVRAAGTAWHGGRLLLTVTATLGEADGSPMRFRRHGASLVRVLPPRFDGTAVATMDVASDLDDAIGTVLVRARTSGTELSQPAAVTTAIVPMRSGEVEVRFTVGAALDPTVLGERDAWELACRIDGLGWAPAAAPVPAPEAPATSALVDGVAVVVSHDEAERLVLDTADRATLMGTAGAQLGAATVEPGSDGRTVTRVPLPRMHASGETELAGTVSLDGLDVAAQLIGRDGAAALVVEIDDLTGAGEIRANFGGDTSPPLFETELWQREARRARRARRSGRFEFPLSPR